MARHELTLPDLDVDEQPMVLSTWLVPRGGRVVAGEPIVEILAGAATVDLPSPADGVLAERLVGEGESINVGQRLAVIHSR